jgi:hypothetical protein
MDTQPTPHDNEGYLLLATGPERYLDMARNLAASLRIMDGTRRICLVHDENYRRTDADLRYFDDYAVLPNDVLYPGFMNKIRMFPLSPYGRAMFVDADCLLVKRDVNDYWKAARTLPFAITGGRRTSGEWKGADVGKLLVQEGAPYLVQMNSGVFAFDRSPASAAFFEGLNDFYLRRREHLGVGLHRGTPAQTDEIYIGLWMGMNGMDSCPTGHGENSWMVSTWRAFWMQADPEAGSVMMRKPRKSYFGVPLPIGGWDRLSPSFIHFIGLKPRPLYQRLSRHFRAKVEAQATTVTH